MNLFVHPFLGEIWKPETFTVSRALTVDVPTAKILLLFLFASFIATAVLGETSKYSESMWCLLRSSTCTGLNVPKPICKVI